MYTQQELLEEILANAPDMEGLLRDSYANYVIQTCVRGSDSLSVYITKCWQLEHAPEEYKTRFWGVITPLMPNIRNTPAGRRLAQKLSAREGNRSGQTSGTMTPQETATPVVSSTQTHTGGHRAPPVPPVHAPYSAVAGAPQTYRHPNHTHGNHTHANHSHSNHGDHGSHSSHGAHSYAPYPPAGGPPNGNFF
jgi:hypothetical protein